MHRLSVLGLTLALVAWRISIVSYPPGRQQANGGTLEARGPLRDGGPAACNWSFWTGAAQANLSCCSRDPGTRRTCTTTFAPKLTDCCHVYGITRRGFGVSSRPASGYDDQRLADDVFRVIEGAKIRRPVLIGHSMAGGEMTTVGRQHSDRLAGLVYLDAIADLEDDPPADKEWAALQQKMPPDLRPRPVCPPVDRRLSPRIEVTRVLVRVHVS